MLRHKYLIAVALVLLTAGLVAAVLYIQSQPDLSENRGRAAHRRRPAAGADAVAASVARTGENPAARDPQGHRRGRRRSAGEGRSRSCGGATRPRHAEERPGDCDSPPQCRGAGGAAAIARSGRRRQAQEQGQGQAAKNAAKKAAKPIEKIEDLAGKTVVIVGRTPANANLLNTILAQYGVAPDKVNKVQISTDGPDHPAQDAAL